MPSIFSDPVSAIPLGLCAAAFFTVWLLRRRNALKITVDLLFFKNNPNPMWIYDSQTLRFLDVNDAAVALYKYSQREFLSMKISDIRPSSEVSSLLQTVAVVRPVLIHSTGWKHQTRDGRIIDVEITSSRISYHDRSARLVSVVDVTERTHSEVRLVDSEAALAASQRIAHLGSFNHDIVSNERTWSDELYRIYGVPPEPSISKDGLSQFDHPEDAETVRETVEKARIARQPYSIDHRVVRADGVIRYVQEQGDWIYDADDNVRCNIGTVLDISDRKTAEEALTHLAYHDALTGLPNRARLAQQLTELLSPRVRRSVLHAVLFIDLDRFKLINDTLGHRFGDDILQAVAARFQHILRDKDIVARPGGDEFIVVFPDVRDKLEVGKLVNRILEVFKNPFAVAGHEHFVSASIGVSLFPDDGADVDTLLQRADAAMYAAKAEGGNSFHFYTANMQRSAARHFRLESALHRALEKNEFRMHYQPLMSVRSGNIVATEALLRWDDEALGAMNPSDFIPFAEETGLIIPIGEWVFKQTCAQAKAWNAAGYPLRMFINVSARQLSAGSLVELLRAALADSDLEPRLIQLELTENSFINATPETLARLHELKSMGIGLAIDDFGMEYSSLNYLRRLPIDTLKIDRSFLTDVVRDRFNQSIVRAIVGMAHDLGLQVIAEGVETPEQYAFLADLNCDLWQGFYSSGAQSPQLITNLLRNQHKHVVSLESFKKRLSV